MFLRPPPIRGYPIRLTVTPHVEFTIKFNGFVRGASTSLGTMNALLPAGSVPDLRPDDLRHLGRTRLRAPAATLTAPDGLASTPSDYDLNPEAAPPPGSFPAPRPAAVLVPVLLRDPLVMLLTVRTSHLPAHAGQIAFPGGKIDAEDTDAVAAALREAEEEVGLPPAHIEPLGCLDPYRTGTGFCITPVVALVRPGFELRLNQHEVADVFEVPLSFLMNPGNVAIEKRQIAGRERSFYAIPFGERYIWGATAGILNNMRQKLFDP